MILDLDAACNAMKRNRLLAIGKLLNSQKRYFYQKKLFHVYIALYWPTYLETRRSQERRRLFLEKLWSGAGQRIVPDMSVEEARTLIQVQADELSREDRQHRVGSVQPPEAPPPAPSERAARPLKVPATLDGIRERVYQMMVALDWWNYRHHTPGCLEKAWASAQERVPATMTVEEATRIARTMWSGMSRKDRARDVRSVKAPKVRKDPLGILGGGTAFA
jgi:hypothetical protein